MNEQDTERSFKEAPLKPRKKLTNIYAYLGVAAIVIVVLYILYSDMNIRMPLVYGNGDELGVFYIIKSIKETGWYLFNPRVGGVAGGNLYDYVFADSLSFFIIKILGIFIDNIYVIANVFYFLNFILAAMTSFYVCRRLHIQDKFAVMVSVLYAFSPYLQYRYSHLWLTPYYLLPLACLVAVWIYEGKIKTDESKFWKNKQFYLAVTFSFLCAFTGFYYAFFTCIIYAIAIFLRIINIGMKKFRKEAFSFFYIFSVCIGIVLQVMPNMIYWMNHGTNSGGELEIRNIGDAEKYALKFVQFILPHVKHRIPFLQELAVEYQQKYPLINENHTASLGIVATVGLAIAFVWIFKKYKKRKGTYASFVLGLFLVGTIGGIGSLFSLLISTPMRCYNRISIMIMFLCLVCVATVLQELTVKMKKSVLCFLLALITAIGIYDQTVAYAVPTAQYAILEENRDFVNQIEDQVESGTLIFQLPYVNWPSGGSYRMFAGYLESDTLRWSFGCMQGRKEARWQDKTANSRVNKMLKRLTNKGYGGVYMDKFVYTKRFGEEKADRICSKLTEKLNRKPLISKNGELYFWKM